MSDDRSGHAKPPEAAIAKGVFPLLWGTLAYVPVYLVLFHVLEQGSTPYNVLFYQLLLLPLAAMHIGQRVFRADE